MSCPDVQSRDIKPVKMPRDTIGQRRLITISYDEIIDFEAVKHIVTVSGRISDFRIFVIIILLQETLFCGRTKAVLYPHWYLCSCEYYKQDCALWLPRQVRLQ